MKWHLQVVKSTGSVIIEPTFITKFSMKPTATPRPTAVNAKQASEKKAAGNSLAG